MTNNNNNALYLFVGALLVAVGVLGYVYISDGTPGTSDSTTTIIEKQAKPDEASSSFNLHIDENGVSATQTTTEEDN